MLAYAGVSLTAKQRRKATRCSKVKHFIEDDDIADPDNMTYEESATRRVRRKASDGHVWIQISSFAR